MILKRKNPQLKVIATRENMMPEIRMLKTEEQPAPMDNDLEKAFAELKRGVHAALETYSNVHRGSGHNSLVTTYLYERAREIVLEYLGLSKEKYTVIYCTPRRADLLKAQLKPNSYQMLSSQDIGLPLGVRALAVDRKALPGGSPFQSGGGTARLVSPGWVIWAKAPDKFEAGTPAIINVIAFACALQLIQYLGKNAFRLVTASELTADEILYHDEWEKYSGRELLEKLRQTLIGLGAQVPTTEGARPLSTWITAPAHPHLHQYGRLPGRRGASPGKPNRR